eukprot:CAMPEP_0185728632 /NCGR_PEP_ID=MMETSP1171-20130828/3975_1 /TAXON_ID=374046 /ORGANISM="Helicotheca tamensis, Strain CCMP826" /LENGTH=76 /DNA_ID=CAMNT_0028397359 /DNA_START=70 /DNA_END=300 /DNA_ORIENTATION=+
MTDFPKTLVIGTICYGILAAIGLALVMGGRITGKLSSDNAGIGSVVVVIATFSMWLFWVSAWMHQWHPLIMPVYEG